MIQNARALSPTEWRSRVLLAKTLRPSLAHDDDAILVPEHGLLDVQVGQSAVALNQETI